jgi:hypothetical protein
MALCEFHLQVPFLKGRAGLPGSDGEEQLFYNQGRGHFPVTWDMLMSGLGTHFASDVLSSQLITTSFLSSAPHLLFIFYYKFLCPNNSMWH